MNRGEFSRLAAMAVAAQATRAPAAIRFDASTRSWLLFFSEIASSSGKLVFDTARGLITQHFVDRRTGRDWAARQRRWGSEIFLIIEDDVFYGASPADRFHSVDPNISGGHLRVGLELPGKLRLAVHYRCFEDSPMLDRS